MYGVHQQQAHRLQYPHLHQYLMYLRRELGAKFARASLVKNSFDQVWVNRANQQGATLTPANFGLSDAAVASDIKYLRSVPDYAFLFTPNDVASAWLSSLGQFFGVSDAGRCPRHCPTDMCSCAPLEYDPPVEPTLLEQYEADLEQARADLQAKLDCALENQRKLNASIRRQRTRLNSVDDFPKNCRLILVSRDGTHVLSNLQKDKDGVWFANGRRSTWFQVYDLLVEPTDPDAELIQVRPAKTIPVGKDFKGYGAPVKAPAKKAPAKKTAAKRPAVKRVTKKAV